MTLRLTASLGGTLRPLSVDASPTRIGRAASNALQLLDSTVSKEHAEFTLVGELWHIHDLGSRNGTRVNGQDAATPLPLRPGDTIQVGQVELRVGGEAPLSAALRPDTSVDSSMRLKVSDVLERASSGVAAGGGGLVHLLAEAGQMLVLPRPIGETCDEILGLVAKAVSAEHLAILLRESPGSDPVPIASRHTGHGGRSEFALSRSILRVVLDENTAVITSDVLNDPRFMAQESIVGLGIHSAMAVPLYDNKDVLGVLYVDSTRPTVTYDLEQLELLTLLANMAAVKISNARLLEAEQVRQRMVQELATATRIQQGLLLEAPAGLPGWSCHAQIEPCHEVGGDLYDFRLRADGHLVVLLGDVSGKGMGAALLMSSFLSTARVLYDLMPDPVELVRRLNGVIAASTDGRSFVTAFLGVLDLASGRLEYVNAGHPPPHLVLGDRVRTLDSTGVPIGMLPDFPWTMGEATLDPGELLVVFSDGVNEAQRGQELFEFERIADSLRELSADPEPAHVAAGLIARIDDFAGGEGRADDVTIVVVHRG